MLAAAGLLLGLGIPAWSQTSSPGASTCQVDILGSELAWRQCWLEATPLLSTESDATIVDEDTLSLTTMTRPSLWWRRDQLPSRLGGDRLIEGWTAYHLVDPTMQVIDIDINGQGWRILTLAERYGLLTQFGSAAKAYGYNVRLYRGSDQFRERLALYVCDFSHTPELEGQTSTDSDATAQIPCNAELYDPGQL
ncbi:hypothetical protein [Halomicronema hongdechloris]|uniref:hypothetical protein n=1 Tax=Halomicronema hongdechloris TaxID=1209493 RepID=UPI000B4CA19D|nr:hypothetical protein [Halomicronema hongdechloris]